MKLFQCEYFKKLYRFCTEVNPQEVAKNVFYNLKLPVPLFYSEIPHKEEKMDVLLSAK